MKIFISTTCIILFIVTMTIFSGERRIHRPEANTNREIASSSKRIVIGVDGLSLETFEYARSKLGYFKSFSNYATHIAPFPSISDYSWNTMLKSREVFGKRARIKYYEGAHYDRDKNLSTTDPREYYDRIASRERYFNGAFEHYLNPFLEAGLYLPTEELPNYELKQLKQAIIEDNKKLVTVMVASNDALAHTRRDSIKFLNHLNNFLKELEDYYKSQGEVVEIILLSDHGQTARFKTGEKPVPLLAADIGKVVTASNLNMSRSLINKKDVVIPIMALANYGQAFFKDLESREKFIKNLQKMEWFTGAVYKTPSRNPNKLRLEVFDKVGNAQLEITRRGNSYFYVYNMASSNPLEIPEDAIGRELSDEEARAITIRTKFPDSFHRLAFSAFELEADFPDLLFTLDDDHYIKGELNDLTQMWQTHGSLSRRSTTGIVASNMSTYDLMGKNLRSEEILPTLNLSAKSLFRPKATGLNSNPQFTVSKIQGQNYIGFETHSEEFSNQRIFEIMAKASHFSKYVFDIQSMEAISGFLKPIVEAHSSGPTNSQFNFSSIKEKVTLEELAGVADVMIRTQDIDAFQKSKEFLNLKNKISSTKKNNRSDFSNPKKIVMKSYSSLTFLERILNLPEFTTEKDNRDLSFYFSWKKEKKLSLSKKLFSEIFYEREIAEKLAPTQIPYLYNPDLRPLDNITFVYVSGIYNSIFDNEIFKMGLDHLSDRLGIRVIQAPVLSACSSEYNSNLINEFLQNDFKTRQSKGISTRYFILGYSKGGVDGLHAFNKDPEFTKKNILGLLTIATPIKGSSILNKSDIPIDLLQLLSHEEIPDVCRNQEKASKSITPEGATNFLKTNAKNLVGLTRYYSISFQSEIKESNILMKATKNIARFGEPNDGVVTVSASRFPEGFGAIDLGTVFGDHLSGIVASEFPQEAFMEAIVATLLELDAFNTKNNTTYLAQTQYSSPTTSAEEHRKILLSLINKELDQVIKSQSVDKMSQIIINKLAGTPYSLNNFSFKRDSDGNLKLIFSQPVINNLSMISWIEVNKSVNIKNIGEIVDIFLSRLQKSGKDLIALGSKVVIVAPMTTRPKFVVPDNDLGYNELFRINIRDLDKFIGGKKVTPITKNSHPNGIDIVFDKGSSIDFRNEYQFSFESSSPLDVDDNASSGWAPYLDKSGNIMAKLTSNNSSIRLTTYSMRFLAADFPNLSIDIQVNQDVPGSNVLFGGTGKDDSAFQFWITFRVLEQGMRRELISPKEKVYTLGYYFGDTIPGKSLQINQIYENYYSNKNYLVAVLPEAHQKLIGIGTEMLGKPILSKNNLMNDLKVAYPNLDLEKIEIIAMTIQHDSNDTKGRSEALFKSINFKP